jgi:hypothetical protein
MSCWKPLCVTFQRAFCGKSLISISVWRLQQELPQAPSARRRPARTLPPTLPRASLLLVLLQVTSWPAPVLLLG